MKHYLLALFVLTFFCCKSKPQHAMPAMEIAVVEASLQNVPKSMAFVGQIYSNYDISVQPRISGFLASEHYSNGMPVKKGQLIYTIDPSQLETSVEQARANHFSAQAQLVKARNDYHRAIPLAKIDALSKLNLDQYQAEYYSAEASHKAAEAALRNAELDLSYTKIYSPIDGIIAESVTAIGDYVGPGTQFAVLTKISSVDTVTFCLQMPVAEYLAYRKRAGITSPSFENDSLLSNIVLSLSDGSIYEKQGFYMYTKKDVGQDMGVIVLVIGFENFDSQLKIGQYASVTADIGSDRSVVVVPQRAVSQTQGINSIWVMAADSSVEYRRIVLGETLGDLWVVESGVSAGEKVLTEGSLKVKSGMKIKPRTVSMTQAEDSTSVVKP